MVSRLDTQKIMQLVDQTHESSENERYSLGVFIDLSKASDTVDHPILLKKLEIYGIRNSNLSWVHSYLKQRK